MLEPLFEERQDSFESEGRERRQNAKCAERQHRGCRFGPKGSLAVNRSGPNDCPGQRRRDDRGGYGWEQRLRCRDAHDSQTQTRSPTLPPPRLTARIGQAGRSSQRRAGPDVLRRRPSRAISTRIRSAARDITSRGGRLFPSARHTAIVFLRRAAIVPQHAHALMCRSMVRRRAGVMSPSR